MIKQTSLLARLLVLILPPFVTDVRESTRKITYWWRSFTDIRVLSLIGCCSVLNFRAQVTTNQRQYYYVVRHQYGVFRDESRNVSRKEKIEREITTCFTLYIIIHLLPQNTRHIYKPDHAWNAKFLPKSLSNKNRSRGCYWNFYGMK